MQNRNDDDNYNRKQFKQDYKNGAGGNRWNRIDSYEKAYKSFCLIINKKLEDYRLAVRLCHYLATQYWNGSKYEKAIEYYNKGISLCHDITNVLKVNLEDEDYRMVLKLLNDLSDTYLDVNMAEPSESVFREFVNVFHLIKKRTTEEQKAFDAKDDYQSVKKYFEDQTTDQSIIKSTEFKNNRQVLYNTRDVNCMMNGINSINVSSNASNNTNKGQFTLPQSNICSELKDSDFRNLGKEYSLLIYNQQNSSEKIETLKQSLNIYDKIKNKNNDDSKCIEILKTQLDDEYRKKAKEYQNLASAEVFPITKVDYLENALKEFDNVKKINELDKQEKVNINLQIDEVFRKKAKEHVRLATEEPQSNYCKVSHFEDALVAFRKIKNKTSDDDVFIDDTKQQIKLCSKPSTNANKNFIQTKIESKLLTTNKPTVIESKAPKIEKPVEKPIEESIVKPSISGLFGTQSTSQTQHYALWGNRPVQNDVSEEESSSMGMDVC